MKKLLVIGLIVLTVAVFSFAKDATEKSGPDVLLALEKTKFKQSLIDKIKQILETKNYNVKVVDHSKKEMDSIAPSDYSVIFITNSGVRSKVRPWIVDWLKKHEGKTESVIVHTTQKKAWDIELNVDALTSASKTGDVDKLAKQYSEKIISKIEKISESDQNIINE